MQSLYCAMGAQGEAITVIMELKSIVKEVSSTSTEMMKWDLAHQTKRNKVKHNSNCSLKTFYYNCLSVFQNS